MMACAMGNNSSELLLESSPLSRQLVKGEFFFPDKITRRKLHKARRHCSLSHRVIN